MFCTSCGGSLPQNARFCGQCGQGIQGNVSDARPAAGIWGEQGGAANFAAPAHPGAFEACKPRPWLRYFARMMDIWIFSVFIGGGLWVLIPDQMERVDDNILGFVLMIVSVPLQAICFAVFGNTLGKVLFGIKVTHNGRALSFDHAIKREFLVYIRGLGAGLPIVSLVTLIVGYNNLSKNGITSWDRENGFVVTHKNPSVGAIIGIIAIVLISIFLVIIGLAEGY